MRFAAIETATEWCSVALWRDGEIVSLESRAANRQGEVVLPMLEKLFARSRVGIGDLEAIAFGAGPGAFTGLRIACGVAQGLAFARGLPVIGISTLEAAARTRRAGAIRKRRMGYPGYMKPKREAYSTTCRSHAPPDSPSRRRNWLTSSSKRPSFL